MWSLYEWFWSALEQALRSTGLYNKKAKLVFLGLDNAGKTTLLHLLAGNRLSTYMTTQKPTTEEFVHEGLRFTTHDLGGHEIARRIWSEYQADANGLVFMVDTSDADRLEEARRELDALRYDESIGNIPILVLGNKIDLVGSVGEWALREKLGLVDVAEQDGSGRPIALYMCSLVKRQGYNDGFKWLASRI